MEEAAQDGPDGDSSLEQLRGLWLAGAVENSVFCGADVQSLPSIRLQVTGSVLLVVAQTVETCRYFQTDDLNQVKGRLMGLEAKCTPDHAELPSMGAAFVRTGDVGFDVLCIGSTHRPLSSSFLWFILRLLRGNPKKELLRGPWVISL